MKPLYDSGTIAALIPQRPPMMLVDAFYGIEDGEAVAGLTVGEDNLFCERGSLCAEGVLEHMAQAAAARAGYEALQAGSPVRLGYIGAVNRVRFGRMPAAGESLTTRVRVVEQVMDITLVEIESRVGGEFSASCRMKIFLEP